MKPDKPSYDKLEKRILELEDRLNRTLADKQFLERIVNGLDDPVFAKDEEHRWVLLNDASVSVMGMMREDLIGKSDYDLFPKEQAEVFWEKDEAVLKSGQTNVNEEVITWHGSLHTISTKKTLLVDPDTGKSYIIGTIRDITDRKNLEVAMAEREALLRTIIESFPFDLFAIGTDGKYFLQNKVCMQHWGNGIGKRPGDLQQDGEVLDLWEDNNRRAFNGETIQGEVEYNIDDKRLSFYNIITPIFKEGEIRGILGMNIEITDLKRAHEELRTHKEHLETLVAERTSALERIHEQLLQSQKMEAVGAMAGGIAHDFNNILATITGTAEIILIKSGPDNPDLPRINRIMNAGLRAKNLCMKLLTFARKEKLEITTGSANAIVAEVTDMLQGSHGKKIRIRNKLDQGIPLVTADMNQITQALLNICINACDAMPDGGILTIETCEVNIGPGETADWSGMAAGRYCLIKVSDTGTGIDEHIHHKVFEPFFTTKERGKGSGLGLSVSLGIVQNHGGGIDMSSVPGAGSTFRLLLPLSGEPVTVVTQDETAQPRARMGTVLVVDDDTGYLKMVEEGLDLVGFDVITAQSGRDAAEIFKQKHNAIALVLLDMIMPGMDGAACFHALRTINPSVKIVLCSGFSKEGKASELLENGAKAFIQKPFSINNLFSIIDSVINDE